MAPPPPPAPPPPVGDLDDFLTNGFDGQPQNEGAIALPSFGATDTNGPMDTAPPPAPPEKEPQVWEKPLNIHDIRKSSSNWSLASDAGLLLYLQEFSHKMLTKTSELEKKVDGLVHETKCTDSRVHNVFNDFLMLANTQFIENRVYDDSEETDQKPDAVSKKEDQTKTREQREAEVIPRVIKALNLGINVLDSAFEQLDANVANSDSEEEDATYRGAVEPILEPKDLYAHRALPYLIGSPAFMQDDNVGVADITEEDMSEEGSLSGSEKTTSESESEYTDETESESETESDVPSKKKPSQIERSQSESETDLFEGEKSSDEEGVEQPKGGALANELAARIGAEPVSKADDGTERDRTVSEVSGTSASSKGKKRKKATARDKAGKRRSASKASASEENMFGEPTPGADEMEDSPFGKKGGLFSSGGGGLFGEEDKDEEGGLFDEPHKARTGSHRSGDDHIYEDITPDEQNTPTTKSGRKIPAGAVPLFAEPSAEDDLFGSSPKSNEAGKALFMRATSAAKERRGSQESSRKKKQEAAKKAAKLSQPSGASGGLFDDDDGDDDGLFAEPASKPAKKEPAKKTADLFDDEDDGDLFGGGIGAEKPAAAAAAEAPRQRADSKKRPAGAVSMFGTLDPLAAKRASGHLEKPEEPAGDKPTPPPVAKKEPKPAPERKTGGKFDEEEGGDLFDGNAKSPLSPSKSKTPLFDDSEGEEDSLFADKETIKVPPAVKTAPPSKPDMKKKAASGGLFDDIEGDGDDDLFGAPSKPKEITKKKPGGGVALFGDADTLSTSPKAEEPKPSVVKKRDKAPKSRTTLSLFDDDEQDDHLFGNADAAKKDDAVTRHRTKSKSVFDDEDVLFNIKEEAPPVDLFGSTKSVSATKPDSNRDKPRSASGAAKSLFSDEEDDEDLFGKAAPKPASKAPPATKAEPATKPRAGSKANLFGDDADDDGDGDGDLFGGGGRTKPPPLEVKAKPATPEVKTKPASPEVKTKPATPELKAKPATPEVKTKPATPEVKAKSATPEVKAKPAKNKEAVEPSEVPAHSDPLLGDQSPPPAPAKPKTPAGAVSMFGGPDPLAVTRQLSSELAGEETKEEAEEEKAGPKAKDKRNRTPSASSASENTSPKPFTAASSNKPGSVIRSVRPPGAKAAGKRISMLQSNIAIDPTAMRPGATPPSREVGPEGVSFDEPPKLQTLSSLNKGRARVSTKRRAPSRRLRTEGATTAIPEALGSGPAGLFSASPEALPKEETAPSGAAGISADASFPAAKPAKPEEKYIPSSDATDFSSPLDFSSAIPPTPAVDDKPKTKPKALDTYGNSDDLFDAAPRATVSPKADGDDRDLFAEAPKKSGKAKSPLDTDGELFGIEPRVPPERKAPSDPFGEDPRGEGLGSKKQGKKSAKTKAPALEDDSDLFATDTTKKKESKPSSAPLLDDDDSLFATSSPAKTKKKKESKKAQVDDEDDLFATRKPAAKRTKSKKPDSDLFSDSTNIFDDIPSPKAKEKKKKKESSLFTDAAEDDIFASPTSAKPKKAKTKKKTTTTEKKPVSGDSIFDKSAPSIFDDPLNAMGK